ncbi:Response regulator receiver domain-containing protein [Myxococcus fulvus]|uniref:Response regulator n=1 Tax=Myxococcus fulvus TaxID=33 RepID=A0A511TC41_MYXFU|nr:response regulator [Myxococcus fulvus]AKF84119.1 chemotaxis protein CheY [Myxococcus fulvus 124B02]GEN10708.1 response regulator [Myxococcus fulvus]SEU37800.1 Response regulator receiver domain-containing protein [Myxococcus fulvus]
MCTPSLVLLVEDHVDSRELLEEFLTMEGFAVETAGNGQSALERLSRLPCPDAVLLDLMMPVMSGWELMRHVREDDRLKQLPVVVVSGAGNHQAMPEGIQGTVPKPVDLTELRATLARVVSAQG